MPNTGTSDSMRKFVRIVGVCLCLASAQFLVGCSSLACKRLDAIGCEVLQEFTVFGPQDSVHFEHHCSASGHNNGASRSAYVIFEPRENEFELRVLAEVAVGWVFARQGGEGVRIYPHRIHASGLEVWAEDRFSLIAALSGEQSGDRIVGESVSEYLLFTRDGEARHNSFELSSRGEFDWSRFKEPDEKGNAQSNRQYGVLATPPGIRMQALPDLAQAYRLLLIARNSESGEEVVLDGPLVDGLSAHSELEKPVFKTLGFWDTMNPAQEGGLWGWFGHAAEYGDCIYARRAAKKTFDDQDS